ncbi:MAG: lysozyme inhibitor LprI family protein [Gallionella sp.]|nr:lysozyme inhibitor LprI family protein [Gallionella sp.]
MRIALTILLIALGSFSQQVAAENEVDCQENQLSANMCASFSAAKADELLNERYQQLYEQLTKSSNKKRLLAAQRAWLKFRDANCLYEAQGSSEEGGSKFPMEYDQCVERLTMQRAAKIEEFLECTVNGCPE